MRGIVALVICVISFYALSVQADAGGVFSLEKKRGKVILHNDELPGTTALFVWLSSAQRDNKGGICHTEIVSSGNVGSYTFTKKQLKGELSVMAFIKFAPGVYPGMGRFVKRVNVGARGTVMSLVRMIDIAESDYVELGVMAHMIKVLGINVSSSEF